MYLSQDVPTSIAGLPFYTNAILLDRLLCRDDRCMIHKADRTLERADADGTHCIPCLSA